MIIGSVAAIAILVWFYHTAARSGRDPVNWAIAGFVVYFMTALLWTYAVNPDIKDAAMHTRSTSLMYVSKYAYIIVALVVSIVFNQVVGKAKTSE